MKATALPDTLNVLRYWEIEGVHGLESECRDYLHFANLPGAVTFMGRVYTKTGWNSDRGIVCYQTNRPYARAV